MDRNTKQDKLTKPNTMLTKKPKYYIGIDVGVNTGFAIWDTETKSFTSIQTLMIHQAFELLTEMMRIHPKDSIFVVVEDARKRKFDAGLTHEKKQGAGSVKRDSKAWEDFLTDKDFHFRLVAPNGKLNKMAESKNINLWKINTKWQSRTSEHARVAALLVWSN